MIRLFKFLSYLIAGVFLGIFKLLVFTAPLWITYCVIFNSFAWMRDMEVPTHVAFVADTATVCFVVFFIIGLFNMMIGNYDDNVDLY